MKRNVKIIAMLLTLALAAAAIACSSAETEITTPAPMETEAEPNGGDVAGEIIVPSGKPEYEFHRIAYDYENGGKTEPEIITSTEDFELRVLPRLNDEARREASAKYNDEFFANNHLVVFTVTYSSGSVIPEVASVEMIDGAVTVTVEGKMNGDVGTADMATHLGIVALDNLHWPVGAPVKIAGPAAADASHRESK